MKIIPCCCSMHSMAICCYTVLAIIRYGPEQSFEENIGDNELKSNIWMYGASVWLQFTALQGLSGEFTFHSGKQICLTEKS